VSHVRWSDVRDKHLDTLGAEGVERGKERLPEGSLMILAKPPTAA
jgi:hypothetical protein